MKDQRITITLGNLGDITATKDAFNELAITFITLRNNIRWKNVSH